MHNFRTFKFNKKTNSNTKQEGIFLAPKPTDIDNLYIHSQNSKKYYNQRACKHIGCNHVNGLQYAE